MRNPTLALLGYLMFTLAAAAMSEEAAPEQEAPPTPDPKWSALEAVTFQLEGLQRDGDPDHPDAMRQVWDFASPHNQEATGPFERFAEMVRAEPFNVLIAHREHAIVQHHVIEDAEQPTMLVVVRILPAEGDAIFYAWVVSKQVDEPVKDCWMTEAVYPVPPPTDGPRKVV